MQCPVSERHSHLHLIGARRHEMGAAERRQEVVQRLLVRQVDHAESNAELGLSVCSRLSTPSPRSKRCRGAMRGGLVDVVGGSFGRNPQAAWRHSSNVVQSRSSGRRPRGDTDRHRKNRSRPADPPVNASASSRLPTAPATSPESYRHEKAAHAPIALLEACTAGSSSR